MDRLIVLAAAGLAIFDPNFLAQENAVGVVLKTVLATRLRVLERSKKPRAIPVFGSDLPPELKDHLAG